LVNRRMANKKFPNLVPKLSLGTRLGGNLFRSRFYVIIIIWLAFFLRVWQLPHLPPGLWYDEAYYSMDAAWLLDGGPWQLFFPGNNGREPLFIYLQVPLIRLFGAAPLTSRLIGPLAGVLTVPLVYVLARRLLNDPDSIVYLQQFSTSHRHPLSCLFHPPNLIPCLAAAGLAISYWHIGLSRSGFRVSLLPLAAAFVFYAFWRGWRQKSFKWLALAGLGLGVSQYIYLAARTLPLVFAIFALAWTLLNWRSLRPAAANSHQREVTPGPPSPFLGEGQGVRVASHPPTSPLLPSLWLGLLLMALVSALVFAPLGWLFYQNLALFSARTGDVMFHPDSPAELITHLTTAMRLFMDGGDPGWRHNFQSRPMLGWLGWLGFWPGLFICLRYFRRPACLFLLTALLTIYLPALLAVPPVHALRLSALLPIYFIIFALGLVVLAQIVNDKLRITNFSAASRLGVFAVILVAVMAAELTLTIFDYFYRWAKAESTYLEYNGPLVDFVQEVIAQTKETAVIIPFQLYIHPTTRYLLHDHFIEQSAPANLSGLHLEPAVEGPAQLVTVPDDFKLLNVGNIPAMAALVWLDPSGAAYVSRPPHPDEQAYLNEQIAAIRPHIYSDRFGRELAHFRPLSDSSLLTPMFTQTTPERTINVVWANQVELVGYEVSPAVVSPGQPITLNLYWRSLTDQTFDARLFLQLIDAAGQPLNQWEGEAFREDAYRWRPNGLLASQHTLWLGPRAAPGPYLMRLGFFDDRTGQRLPIIKAEGERRKDESDDSEVSLQPSSPSPQPSVDQIQLGLFYVIAAGRDPHQPATPLTATFGDSIQLNGVTLPELHNPQFIIHNSQLPATFHWRVLHPTERPYTVFLQLLTDQGQVVSSWDSQPFNGLYPTHLWSPGELITDTLTLPLPAEGLPPGHYRLITGFYHMETGQRLPVDSGGDFVELARFSSAY
jgi:hypothetical protein